MNVEEAIRVRRTLRKFKPYKMPREYLLKILESARLAPSAANAQPWLFVVVEDAALKRQLAETTSHKYLEEASAVIAVLGNPKLAGSGGGAPARSWLEFDIGIAVEHMVLQATELGLASCWDVAFWELGVKRILNVTEQLLPGGWKVMALLPIGLPGETPPTQERKPLDQLVYLNQFGNPYPGLVSPHIALPSSYSRDELLASAVIVENNAEWFYRAGALSVQELRTTFEHLAEDEARHAETYRKLMGGKAPGLTSAERQAAYDRLKGMVSMGLLDDVVGAAGVVKEAKDRVKLLEKAVALEKATLTFYRALLDLVEADDRTVVFKVIDAEEFHLAEVSSLLK